MKGLLLALGFCTSMAAGVVEDWNAAFIEAVRKETPPPCLVSRNLPMMHLAIIRAVEGAEKSGLNEDDQRKAAMMAGELAFELFFPSQTELRDGVREKNQRAQASGPWVALADAAVRRTFKERESDGSSTTLHYVPSGEPGQWRRTPPKFRPPELPHWGNMKPFVLRDVDAFLAPAPPGIETAAFADDMAEVKAWGGKVSDKRSEEETMIAWFWSDFSYTTSPAGHWNDIARELCSTRTLSTLETAKLFATLNVAMADACIVVWRTKYKFNFWRPVTAISDWEPLLETPPHPEYVSGHSGVSGAGAAVLEHFFGKEVAEFAVESDTVKDVKRKFTSFSKCAEEISRSRVLGGIHFPTACTEGLTLGRRVAEEVLRQHVDGEVGR